MGLFCGRAATGTLVFTTMQVRTAFPTMLNQILREGLLAMNCTLEAETQTRLVAYVRLLEKWNRTYNLTAVREPEQMIPRHLLDSLAILPYLKGRRVLDIGTGAGLPGIPLALARADTHFVLLDSNAKKTRFVTQACAELGIKNVEVVNNRVEKYQPPAPFDTIVSRAFSTIADMLVASRHVCGSAGQFLAMKGVYPQEELAGMPPGYTVSEAPALAVPGLSATRHVVVILPAEPIGPT
jgi:16S rRNA (guanine527-N7)-methyltransferase